MLTYSSTRYWEMIVIYFWFPKQYCTHDPGKCPIDYCGTTALLSLTSDLSYFCLTTVPDLSALDTRVFLWWQLSQQNFGELSFAENVNQHAGGSQARWAWVLLTICDIPLPFCFLRTDSPYQGDQGPPKTASSPTAQQAPRSAVSIVHEAVTARQAAPLFVEKFPLLLPWIWWPVSKLLFFPCNIGSLLWSLHFDQY